MVATSLHGEQTFSVDVDRMVQRMSAFGLRPPTFGELGQGIAVTERLLGQAIADQRVVERLQAATGITAWVIGRPVDGFYIILPLTRRGEVSVRNGAFTPSNPDPADIAAKNALCAAVYVGVYAGQTKDSRRSIMQAAAILRVELFGCVPCFARGATGDGVRTMQSLGFEPVEGGLPELYVQEPLTRMRGDAA